MGDITDMATDITDMVIIMDIIWVRDPPMLNQLLPPNLQLPQKPLLKPKLHLGTDTDTDTTVIDTDTDTTDIPTITDMLTITANDPPNLPLKPHPHLITDTDTTDTTVMVTDTDTTD